MDKRCRGIRLGGDAATVAAIAAVTAVRVEQSDASPTVAAVTSVVPYNGAVDGSENACVVDTAAIATVASRPPLAPK